MSHGRRLAGIAIVLAACAGLVTLIVYSVQVTTGFFSSSSPKDFSKQSDAANEAPIAGRSPPHPANGITPMPQPMVLPNSTKRQSPALAIAQVVVPRWMARPPLELQRAHDETAPGEIQPPITIETGFECSPQMSVRKISPTHYALVVQTPYWFMFRVHGVGGKTVRFDLVNPGENLHYWSTLNPVYTYAADLDNPSSYAADEKETPQPQSPERASPDRASPDPASPERASPDPASPERASPDIASLDRASPNRAWNGAALPSTAGQQWHYIADAWEQNIHQFSFVQRFDHDDAVIAMRVPAPPAFCDRWMNALPASPDWQVTRVGSASDGRPLDAITIGSGDRKKNPAILFYSGEFSDDPDAMWASIGAIEYLTGSTDHARSLREQFTFIIVPVLDPTASALAMHMGILGAFMTDRECAESIAYANWMQSWINSGNRLDLAIDFFNVQSAESRHVSCFLMEHAGTRRLVSDAFQMALGVNLRSNQYMFDDRAYSFGWSPDRFGGWLGRRYGPITFAYSVNCQAPDRHLSLTGMKGLGRIFVDTSSEFMTTDAGRALMADVDARRAERAARWSAHKQEVPANTNAIDAETIVSKGVGLPVQGQDNSLIEKWFP